MRVGKYAVLLYMLIILCSSYSVCASEKKAEKQASNASVPNYNLEESKFTVPNYDIIASEFIDDYKGKYVVFVGYYAKTQNFEHETRFALFYNEERPYAVRWLKSDKEMGRQFIGLQSGEECLVYAYVLGNGETFSSVSGEKYVWTRETTLWLIKIKTR